MGGVARSPVPGNRSPATGAVSPSPPQREWPAGHCPSAFSLTHLLTPGAPEVIQNRGSHAGTLERLRSEALLAASHATCIGVVDQLLAPKFTNRMLLEGTGRV